MGIILLFLTSSASASTPTSIKLSCPYDDYNFDDYNFDDNNFDDFNFDENDFDEIHFDEIYFV